MTPKHAFDFHIHSHFSDSDPELSPDMICAQAKAAGLAHLSITDHDNLLPLHTCLALSQKHDIDLIPGCEFSTLWKDPDSSEPVIVHIGGHWLNHRHSVLNQILQYNQSLNFEGYVKEMLYRYNRLLPESQKFDVDTAYEEIRQMHPQAIHRGKRDVVRFLVSTGREKDTQTAYELFAYGGAAHVSPTEMLHFAPMEEVVEAITRHSLATLNHLYYSHLSHNGNQALLRCFKEHGGQCLETIYAPYGLEKRSQLLQACVEYDLLPNCGSDRHDESRPFLLGPDLIFMMLKQRQMEEYGTLNTESWRNVLRKKQPRLWKETEQGPVEIHPSELLLP